MFTCNICNKELKSKNNLNKHKLIHNKKIRCEVCNIDFRDNFNKTKHENTVKHKTNIQTQNNYHNTGDVNYINNIINLTLNVHPFNKTNFNLIKKHDIEMLLLDTDNIINNLHHISTFDNNDNEIKIIKPDENDFKILIKLLLQIFKLTNFNINIEENQNCKILLFIETQSSKYLEYLLLNLNIQTNELNWDKLEYTQFIKEFVNLMKLFNNNIKLDNLTKILNIIDKYFINDEQLIFLLKKDIENELFSIYNKFIEEKETKNLLNNPKLKDRIEEYRKYRAEQCTLPNGYLPPIRGSLI